MPQSSSGPVKWRHFLTGRDDATIYNVSVLSRPAEWHALLLGVLAALRPELAVVVLTYIVGRQFGKQAVPREFMGLRLHVKDAVREPAYWTVSWVVLRGLLAVLYGVPFIPPEVRAIVGV